MKVVKRANPFLSPLCELSISDGGIRRLNITIERELSEVVAKWMQYFHLSGSILNVFIYNPSGIVKCLLDNGILEAADVCNFLSKKVEEYDYISSPYGNESDLAIEVSKPFECQEK